MCEKWLNIVFCFHPKQFLSCWSQETNVEEDNIVYIFIFVPFFFLYHNSHMSFFLCGISLGRGNPDLYRVSRFKARELFLSFSTQFWWSKNHYKLYSNVHDLCVLSMFISPILSNANWEVLYFKFRQQSVYLVRY